MPQQFVSLFAGFGFATAAGLNAWVTLFIVSLAARLGYIHLSSPYDVMTSAPVIIGIFIIMLIEGLADKIPLVDHASHILHGVLQPAAGAVLFASQAGVITGMSPILAFFVGALVAGTIHGARATIRPAITLATLGTGNAVVSTAEDAAAVSITIGAIIAPVLVTVLILIGIVIVLWMWRKWRARMPSSANTQGQA